MVRNARGAHEASRCRTSHASAAAKPPVTKITGGHNGPHRADKYVWLRGQCPVLSVWSDIDWKQRLLAARAEPDDVEAIEVYTRVPAETFEIGLDLCRAARDISRDKLIAVLRAATAQA
jgi:hypothetical protein